MMNHDTETTARTLVADGKGILAADETPGTLTKRFDALGIRSTEQRPCRTGRAATAPPVLVVVTPMKWRRARRVRRNGIRGTTTDTHDLPGPSPGDRRT